MRIQKLGNSNSSLLNAIIDAPENKKDESLRKIASKIMQSRRTAQLDGMGSGISDPTMDPGMSEPDSGQNNEVTKHLVNALIASCGSVEAAHQCLDQHAQPESPEMESSVSPEIDSAAPMPMPMYNGS